MLLHAFQQSNVLETVKKKRRKRSAPIVHRPSNPLPPARSPSRPQTKSVTTETSDHGVNSPRVAETENRTWERDPHSIERLHGIRRAKRSLCKSTMRMRDNMLETRKYTLLREIA